MYRITSDMENSTGNADFPPHLPLSPSSEGPRAQRPSASHPPGPVGHPEVPKHLVLAGMVLPEDLPVQQAHLGKGRTTAALPPQRLKVKIRPARGTGSGRRGAAAPPWYRSFEKTMVPHHGQKRLPDEFAHQPPTDQRAGYWRRALFAMERITKNAAFS